MNNRFGDGASELHTWWGLSYAQYLTLPRTVMQSMPEAWQGKMAILLRELDETIDWRPKDAMYWVDLRRLKYDRHGMAQKGKSIEDPLADYRRGRRRLPLESL